MEDRLPFHYPNLQFLSTLSIFHSKMCLLFHCILCPGEDLILVLLGMHSEVTYVAFKKDNFLVSINDSLAC